MIPGIRLVLLGKQGAGKGTQALKLSRHYHVPHISTGDMFRTEARSGSDLGRELKDSMDAGELVPDDVVIRVVEKQLSTGAARARGFILDGFPRTQLQAKALEEVLAPFGGLDAVVSLEVSTEMVVKRLAARRVCPKCGANYNVDELPEANICENCGDEVVQRDDDTPDAIRRRLALYEEQTAPLIEFYRDRGLLEEIDGVGDPQEILDRTVRALDARSRS